MKSSNSGLIRLIAVFKLAKAALLIATGVGILKLMHVDVAGELDQWVARLGLDPGSHYVNAAMEKATRLTPAKIRDLGLVSFVYAGLFLTEGIGLWMLKRWGEWFTVIITSSLVPVEVWEICRHPSAVKVAVLVVNVGIVGYLVWRIVKEQGGGSGELGVGS
jgi:uncharacterized membrane protein (DUF2068 family)